mgnify:CR=1 FL=1
MKIRSKIILSFLLIVFMISGLSVFSKILIDETQSEIQTIREIKLSYEHQHVSTFNYLSESQSVNTITDSHIFIQHQLSNLIESSSGQYEKNLRKLQELELVTYDKKTNEKQFDSLVSLLDTRDLAFEDFLEKNNAHIVRISEFKKYWGDNTNQDSLDDILINIDKERKLILEFNPHQEGFENIRDDFRNINNNVVDSLVVLLVAELDFVISLIDENDSQLQQTRNTLIVQRDIASQITATSFPSVQNNQEALAMIEPTEEIHFSNAKEMTVSLGESCESNIQSLEDVGIILRQRHDVKEVGENKNPTQVLISVIKCQQGLRINAEDYMNSKIMIKDYQNDVIIPIHAQFDELTNQIIFEMNSPFSNSSIMIYGLYSVTMFSIILLGVIISNSISNPIKKLVDASNKISTGTELINIIPEGDDECRGLSISFNNMINRLTNSTKDLSNFKHALDESSIVAITDKNGIITYVNERFCKISKYSRDELIGQNHRILKSGEHSDKFYHDLWHTISNGKIWEGEIKNKTKDGTYYWVKSTLVPFYDDFGNIDQYLAIRIDITKQKELSEKLIKSERLSAIGALASRISHDLKNPLSILNVPMSNFRFRHEKNFDDADKKTFQRVDNAISRMSHQIDDTLNFVRTKPLQLKNVEISHIIKNVVHLMEIPDGVNINLPLNKCTITCDVQRLEPVFSNLIINAIQSMNNKGEINVRLLDKDEYIIIEIEDSGSGIPEENLEKIFDPLFTTKQTGTGLGLVTCKNIIEQHGGTISVTSPPTIFTIKLPKTTN